MDTSRESSVAPISPHDIVQGQDRPPPNPTIYILGTGSVGKFVAHSLRGASDPPPVTLLYHRSDYVRAFENNGKRLSLTTGQHTEDRAGFEAELIRPPIKTHGEIIDRQYPDLVDKANVNERDIEHLIVTVKAFQTVSAIESIAYRLSPKSTILFIQNGMGIIEEVNQKIFPDPETRPNYMLGINSHGTLAKSPLAATHTGHGTIRIGNLPRVPVEYLERDINGQVIVTDKTFDIEPTRYLMRNMTRVPVLGAFDLNLTDLIQAQLEKLAVNCIVNPLTVMLDTQNGNLLDNNPMSKIMFPLLAEISHVIVHMPELENVPNVCLRFSPEKLEATTVHLAQQTAANISSMLQDNRKGQRTEIEYINGYIVSRAEQQGFKAVMNYMLMQLVLGKNQMTQMQMGSSLPFSPESSS